MNINFRKAIPVILPMAIAGSIAIYLNSEEQKASRVVEAHLKAIKSGGRDLYETIDVAHVPERLGNVLDYEYIETVKKEKVPDEPLVIDRAIYDDIFRNKYKSYDEYVSRMRALYGDRATRKGNKLFIRPDTFHEEFTFLYELTTIDRAGRKLRKKYFFEVRPTPVGRYGYEIAYLFEP
jgi:hypothetical protein